MEKITFYLDDMNSCWLEICIRPSLTEDLCSYEFKIFIIIKDLEGIVECEARHFNSDLPFIKESAIITELMPFLNKTRRIKLLKNQVNRLEEFCTAIDNYVDHLAVSLCEYNNKLDEAITKCDNSIQSLMMMINYGRDVFMTELGANFPQIFDERNHPINKSTSSNS